jgi:hypothetical protein
LILPITGFVTQQLRGKQLRGNATEEPSIMLQRQSSMASSEAMDTSSFNTDASSSQFQWSNRTSKTLKVKRKPGKQQELRVRRCDGW